MRLFCFKMTSTHRSNDYHCVLVWNSAFLSLALLCLASYAECRWCTRIESYQTTQTLVQRSKCNQSYEEFCEWFSSKQCTRYETVDCLVKKNHTVLQYRMVTTCCQGFKLDPINNMTCIVDPEFSPRRTGIKDENNEIGDKAFTRKLETKTHEPPSEANGLKEATSVTIGFENVSATQKSVVTGEPKSQNKEDANTIEQLPQEERDDGIFFNLSSGAYTGIICAFVLLLCILLLIGLHFLKNQRRLKAKANQESFDMDVKQKMISFPARA